MRRVLEARLRSLRQCDAGSIMPLIIFFTMLGLIATLLVTAATSLYLAKKQLFTVADGAALVGAEAFELDAVAFTPEGVRPNLDSADVAVAVGDYVAGVRTGNVADVQVVSASSPDGLSAEVTLSGAWAPPVLTMFVPEGLPIEATATARSVFE